MGFPELKVTFPDFYFDQPKSSDSKFSLNQPVTREFGVLFLENDKNDSFIIKISAD